MGAGKVRWGGILGAGALGLFLGCASPTVQVVAGAGGLGQIVCDPASDPVDTQEDGAYHQYVVPYGEARDKKITFTGVLVDLALASPIGIGEGDRLVFRVDGATIVLDRRMRIETEGGSADVAVFDAPPAVLKAIGDGREVSCLIVGRRGTFEKAFTANHLQLFRSFAEMTKGGALNEAAAPAGGSIKDFLKKIKLPKLPKLPSVPALPKAGK